MAIANRIQQENMLIKRETIFSKCVSQIKITTKMTKFTLGEELRGKNHTQNAAQIKTGRCKKIISKQYAL